MAKLVQCVKSALGIRTHSAALGWVWKMYHHL